MYSTGRVLHHGPGTKWWRWIWLEPLYAACTHGERGRTNVAECAVEHPTALDVNATILAHSGAENSPQYPSTCMTLQDPVDNRKSSTLTGANCSRPRDCPVTVSIRPPIRNQRRSGCCRRASHIAHGKATGGSSSRLVDSLCCNTIRRGRPCNALHSSVACDIGCTK